MTVTRERSLLRTRDFRRFWVGETVSELGSGVTSAALPIVAVVTLHADALQVSGVAAAAWLPWVVIGLPVGAWVDRLSRRRVMLCADAASLILWASIPIAAWSGVLSIAQLLGVALLGGVARVFFETAYQVYLPSLVAPAQLGSASSLVQGSQSATGVGGPGLAGGLTALFGAVSGLLFDAASFLVSACCLATIKASEPRAETPAGRGVLRQEIADGVRFVARDAYLRGLALYGAISNLGLAGYQSLVVVFLIRDVGLDGALVGVLLAATSVGGVIGAAAAGWIGRHFGTARGMILCLLTGSPAGLLVAVTGPGARLAVFVVGSLVLVAAIVAGNVLQGGWRPHYCPRELYGRITASGRLLNYGTIPLGALLAGTLATALGTRAAIAIMTAVVALGPAVLLFSPLRRLRDLPEGPPTAGCCRACGADRARAWSAASPAR